MTRLLEKAFNQAAKLPGIEQNIFAKWLLDELSSERRWGKTFAESEDVLEKLAKEAVKEYKEGKTRPLNPEEL